MKRFRWPYLVLLLIFAGTIVGTQFHAHPAGQDQITAHCKSCQVSQASYESVPCKELRIADPVLHTADVEQPVLLALKLLNAASGRAPPLV